MVAIPNPTVEARPTTKYEHGRISHNNNNDNNVAPPLGMIDSRRLAYTTMMPLRSFMYKAGSRNCKNARFLTVRSIENPTTKAPKSKCWHLRHQTTLATASVSKPSSYVMDEELIASIRRYDRMTPRPQNLQRILEVSSSPTSLKEFNVFLRKEYMIRCAERICMIEEKIPNFADIPELVQAYDKHVRAFVTVRDLSPQDDFLPVVRAIVEGSRTIPPLMLKGFYRLIHCTPDDEIDEDFTNEFMNQFLLNRIGSSVLMSQYLAVATGDDPPHPTSIIDPHCNVTAICRQTAQHVRNLCYHETGYRPSIQVIESHTTQDMEKDFAFVPAALSYILQELLKNSAVATAKQQQKQGKHDSKKALTKGTSASRQNNDDILVVICADPKRVMIHVGDRAGGIPFEATEHIWSYLYTTKHEQSSNTDDNNEQQNPPSPLQPPVDLESSGATDLNGFGVGLPMARLYAKYLGGNINLVSLPGYGTHAYVFVPRLPEKMVETVPERATGWQVKNAYNAEFIL